MFKIEVGSIIVCAETKDLPKSLTMGKEYKVLRHWRLVDVLNDKNGIHSYSKNRFITLEKSRRLKLEKICSKLVKR